MIITKPRPRNNYVLVTFDSCRYDSFMKARPKVMRRLGKVERRWSYASWTSPSHYNLLIGLMPHTSPSHVYASEYYKKDFVKFNERLGTDDIQFRSLVPKMYLPLFLKETMGYRTHAMVSLPVLNPKTILNNGFDTYRLMDKHNDMRAMVRDMKFADGQPNFFLMNVGETHYPYALPNEPPEQWPRISGVHGVFKHLDDQVVGGKLLAKKSKEQEKFFDNKKMKMLRDRQIDAVKYLDGVVEELFDTVPKNTYITLLADHGELFGEDGYFGHGPIQHEKVYEVPFVEGKIPMKRTLRDLVATLLLLGALQQPVSDVVARALRPAEPAIVPALAFGYTQEPARLPARQAESPRHNIHLAYIGPGAGFAFLGSFLTLIAGFFLSMLSLLLWPFRMLYRMIRQRQGFKHARIKKLIFLGLDGLDPRLTERFMAEGKLPNLSKLRETGSYQKLRTTFPSLSPVAWSTFATGVNPAKHNIFDFLNRNLKSYVPELSSARVNKPRRVLKLGKLILPLSGGSVDMMRKSQTFWKLLGDQNIGCTILRVPITFPPEKFNGRLLSAMCTPDLRGTQGSFSFFSTKLQEATYEGGSRYPLQRKGGRIEGSIEGPENSLWEDGGVMQIPFTLTMNGASAKFNVGDETYTLKQNEYTPWIKLNFKVGLGATVTGIARFMLTETEPEVSLYCTPIQIDPEKPALPISHPSFFASYLAKLLGTFSTLGMAEDTWALNEGVIDEQGFLDQAYLTFAEREAMFLNALEKTRRGVVACVFDTSDRVQHMFFRYLEGRNQDPKYQKTIEDLYQRMDVLVGKAMQYQDKDTVLFVLSDHGFCSFRRGLNLNSWLLQNGYLALQNGDRSSGPYFKGVDWSRTKAYTLGLGGLYLNVQGREAEGIVKPGEEAEAVKRELVEKLSGLLDEDTGEMAIRKVWATNALYKGPYLQEAPDMIVGYCDGFRTSWDAAVGKVTPKVCEDNNKAWSGDHCVDPLVVPGVLFCNRKIDADAPGIEDLAPTALHLFGVKAPAWMEGKSVFKFA